jgi:predicted Fe-S protein YdhL (DUF1289 family)
MTPEERSAATKARWAALSPEQKAERLAKLRAGKAAKVAPVPAAEPAAEPEAPALKIKKPKMSHEERSEAAKARWVALSDEDKAERLTKMRAGRPVVAPKEPKVKMTKEERAAATRARWAALSDEDKAQRIATMVAGRAAARATA